jgi:hypothetical protein
MFMLSTEQSPLQKHIQFLENAHREEMEQHAPLYGVGLESLSMESLENLLRIHEDGIKNIHALQHQLRNGVAILSQVQILFNSDSLQPTAQYPIADGHSTFVIPNGVHMHKNRPNTATTASRFIIGVNF